MSGEDDKVAPLPVPTTSEDKLSDNEIQPADDSISNVSTHMPGSVNNPVVTEAAAAAAAGNEQVPDNVQPPPDVEKLKPPKSSSSSSSIMSLFKRKPKQSLEINSSSKNADGSTSDHDEGTNNEREALKNLIEADLYLIDNVKERATKYTDLIEKEHSRLNQLENSTSGVEGFRQMKRRVKMLKQLVTSKHKEDAEDKKKYDRLRADDSADNIRILDPKVLMKMPSLYASRASFMKDWAFKDFEARYNALDKVLKLCLLCFSVFPENEIIKKRVMIYWWIGEGFAPPSTGNTQQLQPNDNLGENTTHNGDDTIPEIQDALLTEDTMNSTQDGSSSKDQEEGNPSGITQKENKSPDGTINQNQNGTQTLTKQRSRRAKFLPDQLTTQSTTTVGQPSRRANSLPDKLPTQSTSTVGQPSRRSQSMPTTIQGTTAEEDASKVTKTAEDYANEFFKKLIDKGFIEPVHEKHPPLSQGKIAGSCKLHPFTRSMVIILAENANFFDFDDKKGSPAEEYSKSLRACLTGNILIQSDKLERLHTLFNVNVEALELRPELLERMKNLNVLYLGRWQSSPKHHIEVEDMKNLKNESVSVLNGLESLNHLKFLSIQGISRITELPKSFCQLSKLTILDIRACHNLELLPEEIGLLKNLTHLDMSECYLLDQMPKGLSSLCKLQVLKGFVVTEDADEKKSCKLSELLELPLRKLSIYTGLMNFPSETDLRSLNQFKSLFMLTIAWGRGSLQDTASLQEGGEASLTNSKDKKKGIVKAILTKTKTIVSQSSASKMGLINPPELPSQLKKLNLVCFPRTETPEWMKPSRLGNLKRLYIRGGKFFDLGQIQDVDDVEKAEWKVEVLRLKYLDELEMEWGDFLELFPHVFYLEKVRCPKLTFFPCNQSGVWVRKPKKTISSKE